MNLIYIYDGPFEIGEAGWNLIRTAAAQYGMEKKLPYDFGEAEMTRTEKGKPFFVDIPVDFSLSHSGMMWMCIFSDKPCGLDLQQVEKQRQWENICKRKYSSEEQHYVELWGIEGFYDIWVRKEAFGKCTGQGIFSEMPSMADEKADLKETIEWNDTTYYMDSIEISPEMKCAVCTTEKSRTELRILG